MDRHDAAGRRVSIHYFDCADDEEAFEVANEFLPPNGLVEIWRETALVATLSDSDHTTLTGVIANNLRRAGRVSRTTQIDGVVVRLFDGLPVSASRLL
jgi:hypothetical protein